MSEPHPLPTDQKGLSGLAWTGITCGIIALVLLAIIFGRTVLGTYLKNRERRPAVEQIVESSADLGKVSSNDFTGQMELGSNSGARYHVSYDDLLGGRFSYLDSRGNMTTLGSDFSTLPKWVPKIPDAVSAPAVSHSKINGKERGSYSMLIRKPEPEVHILFHDRADANGFSQDSYESKSSIGCGTVNLMTSGVKLKYSDSASNREIHVMISEVSGEPTQVEVVYEEK